MSDGKSQIYMMEIFEIDIEKVKPYEKNPRTKQAIDRVAESLKQFGWQQPIVVDKNMIIVAGHTRYQAAMSLNMKTVPVRMADDLTDLQIKAYRMIDNKTNELASWDYKLLNEELNELLDNNFDIEEFGFDLDETQKLSGTIPEFELTNDLVGETNIADDLSSSNIKMVQLFLDTDTEPLFKKMISELQKLYETENLTDTVYQVIKSKYESL